MSHRGLRRNVTRRSIIVVRGASSPRPQPDRISAQASDQSNQSTHASPRASWQSCCGVRQNESRDHQRLVAGVRRRGSSCTRRPPASRAPRAGSGPRRRSPSPRGCSRASGTCSPGAWRRASSIQEAERAVAPGGHGGRDRHLVGPQERGEPRRRLADDRVPAGVVGERARQVLPVDADARRSARRRARTTRAELRRASSSYGLR